MNPIYWYLLMDDDEPASAVAQTAASGDCDAGLMIVIMVLCIILVGITVKFLWDIAD